MRNPDPLQSPSPEDSTSQKPASFCIPSIDTDGSVPCLRCKRDGLDCVLGGSNRGGRRVRKKPADSQILPTPAAYGDEDGSFHGVGNVGTSPWPRTESNHQQEVRRDSQMPRSGSATPDDIPFPNLQNPSDALGILARVAETSTENRDPSTNGHGNPPPGVSMPQPLERPNQPPSFSYWLLDSGRLSVPTVCQLLIRYQQNYHPYYPLAPAQTFDTSKLAETAKSEPHLLTAILVISSKDLVEESHIYESCSDYMKSLVSNLAAGGDADVEAVEALLLLAEWAPYTQRGSGKVGKGEEDKESWMHVGLALRIGYFLALDRYSFRVVDDGKDPNHSRKRLIWTAAYICDRHISIRIGKAFWSRGPGPMTSLRREDYPSLIPRSSNEEDHASIFQANLELTQLFSNVHDVLYSNPGSSFRSHLSGSYIKFIDDFRSAIYGWKSVWGTLTCSAPLKACLLMSYDYLRLYTNAFAFQATVRRAMPIAIPPTSEPTASTQQSVAPSSKMQAPQRVFCNNVGAVGDARFIYEGLDAAKAILTTANNFVDPEKALRHMPLRYYLYLVYAGVFLYRARCTGVIGSEEDRAIRAMVNETIARLQRSSAGAGTEMQHPGSRYSQLLKLLWAKVPRKDKATRASYHHPGTHIANTTLDNNGFRQGQPGTGSAQTPSQAGSIGTGESPAVTEQMGDFGWTDLSAVGEFAINGAGSGANVDDYGLWTGFLPLDMGMGMVGQGLGWDNTGLDGHELGMAF
ncbi:uncharacterized protein BDR25DRAFT_343714 [Lindgomyces ingoldianus]|uniref:Uncharacterized protein n=1 Tax=Lindgomyces ingoldianus TaxID=673940 RepID=A0ACB6QT96_9PLEO|nr:uncharacterized protein BDR25DRAFT_343714 [Lindgomyces ingoldianus]KAF2469312.1 hypothetical protein BDR25DRAFT_343714 [Lindgomyces ingoldianus]